MTAGQPNADGVASDRVLRHAKDLPVAAARELVKTVALLLLLILTVWLMLELFRGETSQTPWYDRLWETFAGSGRDKNGLPIAPRFIPSARRSLAIVLTAAVLLGTGSLALGYLFATRPAFSVLRPVLGVISSVPAFLFFYLGMPSEPVWLWPGICLAIGDLNAAAMTSHCYNGIRRELNQPYVLTALGQGLTAWSDVWPRAVLITLQGIRTRVPHLLGGTVAIEYAYNIHGLGQLALGSILSSRPDYNVLVWIAGLGIVVSRMLSLVDQVARGLLTPERGRTSAWADEGTAVGLGSLWRSAAGSSQPLASRTVRLVSSGGLRTAETAGWLTINSPQRGPHRPKQATRRINRLLAYWRFSMTNRVKMALAGLIMVLGSVVIAVVLWGGRYSMLETDAAMLPSSAAHPLGTNENGEDMLSAIAIGGRELFVPIVIALAVAIGLGGTLGTIAGLSLGTATDFFMNLYAELLESVPKLIWVLAALTFISYSHYSIKLFLVMGLAFAPLVFRAVRDEVGALRTSLFLEAAITLGIPRRRILWTHIVRNHAMPVLAVEAAILTGYLMLYDAILGYCQVRQRGEVFTWGNLLGTGIEDFSKRSQAGLSSNELIVWGPFVAMLLAIAGSAVMGDSLKSIGRSVRFSQ